VHAWFRGVRGLRRARAGGAGPHPGGAATEILEAAIRRIERLNPTLNAVVTKVYDEARAEALALDAKAPFVGVPFLLKDLGGAQAGVPLSAGSRFFAHAPHPRMPRS
jgi:Asp-tRNA(Asn)/Glu-tRNA(Gln) amidotransferase A subunit family amidase